MLKENMELNETNAILYKHFESNVDNEDVMSTPRLRRKRNGKVQSYNKILTGDPIIISDMVTERYKSYIERTLGD